MKARSSGSVDGLKARLIAQPDDMETLTFTRLADERVALARGLSEYFTGQTIDWGAGRQLSFTNVLQVWGAYETPGIFPSLVVVGFGEGESEEQLAPETLQCGDGSGRYVRVTGEFSQTFNLEIWTTDPTARSALSSMVADLLNPNDWMIGLRLELPYYFNARARYERISSDYVESADNAQKRWWQASVQVLATIAQIVPVGPLPDLKVIRSITVNGKP